MFGRKKKLQNDRDRELEEVLRGCKEWMQREKEEAQGRRKDEEKRFQALERQLEERDAVLREMKEKWNAWEKAFGRQSDSLENLLDELDELGENSRQESILAQELKEERKREKALLDLACFCREQMDLTSRYLKKEPGWADQCRMMEQEAERYLRAANLQETGRKGETVDYDIHEVLKAVATPEKELAGTVAEVYRRGRIWQGQVISRAQVAAYRFEGGTEE